MLSPNDNSNNFFCCCSFWISFFYPLFVFRSEKSSTKSFFFLIIKQNNHNHQSLNHSKKWSERIKDESQIKKKSKFQEFQMRKVSSSCAKILLDVLEWRSKWIIKGKVNNFNSQNVNQKIKFIEFAFLNSFIMNINTYHDSSGSLFLVLSFHFLINQL